MSIRIFGKDSRLGGAGGSADTESVTELKTLVKLGADTKGTLLGNAAGRVVLLTDSKKELRHGYPATDVNTILTTADVSVENPGISAITINRLWPRFEVLREYGVAVKEAGILWSAKFFKAGTTTLLGETAQGTTVDHSINGFSTVSLLEEWPLPKDLSVDIEYTFATPVTMLGAGAPGPTFVDGWSNEGLALKIDHIPSYRNYVDGESFALGEWLYDPINRKTYKSTLAGAQAGTFADRLAAGDWTEVGSFGLFSATATQFKANIVGGSALNAAAATATIPGLLPDAANLGTGIGSAANDKLSLIANSKELMRIDGVGSTKSITTDGNMTIGQGAGAPSANKLTIFGGIGPSVSGKATGQLVIKSNLSGINDTAIMTGHSSFNGDTQQWYLGGVSSGNQHVAFINRNNAEFQIWTSNSAGLIQTGDKAYIFKNADNSINFSKDGMMTFNGTTHGIRLPNHTTTTRLALTHANGLIIWDDTLDILFVSVNGVWKTVTLT